MLRTESELSGAMLRTESEYEELCYELNRSMGSYVTN